MQHPVSALFFLWLVTGTIAQAQTIWHVSPDGSGDGTSWAAASSLTDAVDNAVAGDELWLKQGTYPISSTISIDKTLEILGGFSGLGNQRDPALYPSIIDGQHAVSIIRTGLNSNDMLFEGISFINGYADIGTDVNDIKGGALYISGNGTRINNCIFRDNTSENRIGSGAIYLWNTDNIVIENSHFENNRVIQNDGWAARNIGGGAIHIRFGTNNRIENCRFVNNFSYYSGGAIDAWGEDAQIINCHFEDNRSGDNGGAILVRFERAIISNSVFRNNSSEKSGGAIYLNADPSTITNSIFSENSSLDNGGAIFNSSELSIFNSSFTQNTSSDKGGALYNGQKLSVSNSLFNQNKTTTLGGAIYSREELYVTNSTFVFNEKTAIAHPYRESSEYYTYQTHIFNSIFFGNTAGNLADVDLWPDVDRDGEYPDQSEKDFRRNIFQENTYGSNNLMGVDPLFQDFSGDDFSLRSNSPAIEYGRNPLYTAVAGTGPETDNDLGGNDRLFGDHVDAGAYEHQSASTLTPPGCVTNVTPTDNATDVPIDANITWDAVVDATGYRISIGTTSGGTDIAENVEVTTGTSFNPPADFPENETVYVTVVPYNAVGKATGCPEIRFTTEILPTVPGCATNIAPSDNTIDVPVDATITWDAVVNADGYYLTIGTTSGGTDIADNEEVTGTSFNLAMTFDENTTYYVSVIPFNAVGEAEGCTEINFTTETVLKIPECTIITAPIDNATDVAIDASISWTSIDDADGYRISIGTTAGGTDIADSEEVTGTSYALTGGFDENTTYYVSVISFNNAGEAEGCTEISFVTETVLKAPECTTITAPEDEATDVGLGAGITWSTVDRADGYRIFIGTTAGGTDILDGEEVTGTSYTPATDWEENTTYYVTVVPFNAAGEAEGCTEISFTTATLLVAPECTTITAPEDEATDVGLGAGITWSTVDRADGYRIFIGTTAGGTDILDGEEVTGTAYTTATDWEENTTYYVTVVPYNAAGEAEGCTEISFTTATLLRAPECTPITFPENEATDVGLDAGITWPVTNGVDGYRIYISTTTGGADILDGDEVTGTTYTPTTDWEENTTYYVTVVPFNAAGEAEGCTEISFTTTTLLRAPDCTTVTSPIDGAGSTSLDAGITWTAVEGAEGYRISIGTTPGGTEIADNETVMGTVFHPAFDFAENTPYYLSVVPFNAAGEATGCSQTRFVIIPDENQTGKDVGRTKYGFSPNGDGINDFWEIDGIEQYPDNTVSIYNRWGDRIFEIRQYDNQSRVFKGVANQLTRLGAGILPAGTYFFIIQYRDNQETKKVEGFLVLKR